jgi:hypothetical protein
MADPASGGAAASGVWAMAAAKGDVVARNRVEASRIMRMTTRLEADLPAVIRIRHRPDPGVTGGHLSLPGPTA